ncbi:MAG: glutamyl-tRNA reductase [Janthinobacterium lividum]
MTSSGYTTHGKLGSALLLVGVNHMTAPIAVRERLAIPTERLAEATRTLVHEPGVREAMILSTCNRVELLTVCEADAAPPLSTPVRFLHRFLDLSSAEVEPHLYQFRENDAVRHLFRVASSLDSMIVGEPQILGQVKQSFAVAREVGAVKSTLDPLLQRAFSVAKRVRTETQIGATTVSVASVAADLARKIFGTLAGKTVLMVGAGKMSDLTARHLIQQGANTLLVSNRTEARAEKLADALRTPAITTGIIPFAQIQEQAHRADIVITSTGAGQIFTPAQARSLLARRRNRPIFFIDIAVPRDVAPEVNAIEGCFVYDIDDLQQVAQENRAGRTREAEAAERIVALEVARYSERQGQAPATEAIKQLLAEAETTRQTEFVRGLARLGTQPLSPEQHAAMEALTRSLTAKLLHSQIAALRSPASDNES